VVVLTTPPFWLAQAIMFAFNFSFLLSISMIRTSQLKVDFLYKKLPLTECKKQFSYPYSFALYYLG